MALVDQFAALGDAVRLKMLEMLSEKSRPVHELAEAFDISRPAISRHLRVLKDAGLVKEEKRGRENVYALQRARLKPVSDWAEKHRSRRPPKAAAKAAEPVEASRAVPVTPPVAPPQMGFDF